MRRKNLQSNVQDILEGKSHKRNGSRSARDRTHGTADVAERSSRSRSNGRARSPFTWRVLDERAGKTSDFFKNAV